MFRGTIDLPASDTVLTKFSAYYIQNDGWLENTAIGGDFNDKDSIGLRADVRFIPNDDLTWDISLDYIDDAEASILGQIQGDDRISTSILPSLPTAGRKSDEGYGNYVESLNLVSNLEFSLAGGEANLILGYRNLEQQFLVNFPGLGSDDFLD